MDKIYMCIDLKSFYASVECRERNLDPLNTNLVVADLSRTEKTVCLAVSPSLKQYGIGGRARLYEVIQEVNKINNQRRKDNKYKSFRGKSYLDNELKSNKDLELDYIVAKPQMAKYMKYSTDIYKIYLKYISEEDIFVYSIDEVFCDITHYLKTYNMTPRELVTKMIHDVYKQTGITATAGIGTNLYLAKIAMDIVAKHCKPDQYGVRIAALNEKLYREKLWDYKPLTKFWRIGKGIAKRLEDNNMFTMGDIARCSEENEELLYKLFGVNAELIIDHAWGYEPCTIKSVKNYKPMSSSLSSGQVLHEPYNYKNTKLVVKEMIDLLALDLVAKKLKTNQIILNIGYDIENIKNSEIKDRFVNEIATDFYGREVPKDSHGTINLDYYSSSSNYLMKNIELLYEKIINKNLLVRRINISVNNLINENEAKQKIAYKQFDIFSNFEKENNDLDKIRKTEEQENKIQNVVIDLKRRYGKNAILKGINLEDGATAIDRNKQIGGHSE